MNFQAVGGTPISKLKDRFISAEIFTPAEFLGLSIRQDLNPSEIVYYDEEKAYFYNAVTCHYYFYKRGKDEILQAEK
jgi:hypothetical protein